MAKNKFAKQLQSAVVYEKKAQDFVNSIDSRGQPDKLTKEPAKILYLRVPGSFWNDIQRIMDITGLSMNATCLDLLRPAIKRKLKDLAEEE